MKTETKPSTVKSVLSPHFWAFNQSSSWDKTQVRYLYFQNLLYRFSCGGTLVWEETTILVLSVFKSNLTYKRDWITWKAACQKSKFLPLWLRMKSNKSSRHLHFFQRLFIENEHLNGPKTEQWWTMQHSLRLYFESVHIVNLQKTPPPSPHTHSHAIWAELSSEHWEIM